MFGDIANPHLAGSSNEIMARHPMGINMCDQVIMDRWAWTFPVLSAFLPIGRPQPVLGTQLPGGAFTHGDARSLSLVTQIPLTCLRVITMSFTQRRYALLAHLVRFGNRLGKPPVVLGPTQPHTPFRVNVTAIPSNASCVRSGKTLFPADSPATNTPPPDVTPRFPSSSRLRLRSSHNPFDCERLTPSCRPDSIHS